MTEFGIVTSVNDVHLSKAYSPIVFNDELPSNIILDNAEHLENALDSIEVTEEGIVISGSEVQPLNANNLIVLKDEGLSKVTFSKDEQSQKVSDSIDVNDDGIVISRSEVHSLNAYFSIEVTVGSIVIWTNDEHP